MHWWETGSVCSGFHHKWPDGGGEIVRNGGGGKSRKGRRRWDGERNQWRGWGRRAVEKAPYVVGVVARVESGEKMGREKQGFHLHARTSQIRMASACTESDRVVAAASLAPFLG